MSDPTTVINVSRIVHLIGWMMVAEIAVVTAILVWLAVMARRVHRRETTELVALVWPQAQPLASGPRVHVQLDEHRREDVRRRAGSASPGPAAVDLSVLDITTPRPADHTDDDAPRSTVMTGLRARHS